ncbi:hypothetical protein CQW23_25263 [Capsicum baccatum]|uniref:Transmembrane protein n=1 Tax=Capsicum baccatum TaxID=33114 RepID=A0A2G2VKI6_CAPBA|nr:hypothetical protein CQW23_25263 [Capsicum baccatum]
MGNMKKQNLVIAIDLLLISSLLHLLHTNSTTPRIPSDNVAPSSSPYGDDHDYMIKNSEPPYFMKKQITGEGGGQGLMTTTTCKKKIKKDSSTRDKMKTKMKTSSLNLKNRERSSSGKYWSRKRTYSAMLPKGFVPPSGSSMP